MGDSNSQSAPGAMSVDEFCRWARIGLWISVQSGPTHLRCLSAWDACHFTRIGGLRFNADRRPKGAHRNAENSLSAKVLSGQ